MPFSNPLDFPNYEKKVEAAREKTNLNEAIVIGKAKIDGNPAVVGVCDARFIMSSMGHVVGAKITEAVERATKEKLPVILFACSGGARTCGTVTGAQVPIVLTSRSATAEDKFYSILLSAVAGQRTGKEA